MPGSFVTNDDYYQSLHAIFGPCLQSDDPLLSMFKVAIAHDKSPVDAMYYWIRNGCKNSGWFIYGLRQQKELLNLLTSDDKYAEKYAVEFVKYLAKISREWNL